MNSQWNYILRINLKVKVRVMECQYTGFSQQRLDEALLKSKSVLLAKIIGKEFLVTYYQLTSLEKASVFVEGNLE